MEIMDAARLLADAVKESDAYKTFSAAKEKAFENETAAALLKEYEKLSTQLQMFALTGREMSETDMTRYQQMAALLYATPDTSQYLLSQMNLQKQLADIFAFLSEQAGIPINLPDIG